MEFKTKQKLANSLPECSPDCKLRRPSDLPLWLAAPLDLHLQLNIFSPPSHFPCPMTSGLVSSLHWLSQQRVIFGRVNLSSRASRPVAGTRSPLDITAPNPSPPSTATRSFSQPPHHSSLPPLLLPGSPPRRRPAGKGRQRRRSVRSVGERR